MARPGVSIGRLLAEGMSYLMEDLDDEAKLDYEALKNRPIDTDDINRIKRMTDDFAPMTKNEKAKLSNIPEGVTPNVKPDWDAADGDDAAILNKPDIPTSATLYTEIESNVQTLVDTGLSANNIRSRIRDIVDDRFTAVKATRSYVEDSDEIATGKVSIGDDQVVFNNAGDVPKAYLDIRNVIGFRMRVKGKTSGAQKIGPVSGITKFGSGGNLYCIDGNGTRAVAYTEELQRKREDDIDLAGTTGGYAAGFTRDNKLYAIVKSSSMTAAAEAYGFDNTRQSASDISLALLAGAASSILDVAANDTTIYLLHPNVGGVSEYRLSTGVRISPTRFSGVSYGKCLALSDDMLYIIAGTSTTNMRANAFDLDGTRQTLSDITLDGADISTNPQGAFVFNNLMYVMNDTRDRAYPYDLSSKTKVDDADKEVELPNIAIAGGVVTDDVRYHTIESVFTEETGTFQADEDVDISFEYPAPFGS